MTARVRYNTMALTHEGCVRTANEDSHLHREDAGLWMVADGMGGHQNGKWASTSSPSPSRRRRWKASSPPTSTSWKRP